MFGFDETLYNINEKIIKTDEVLSLLSTKKKELKIITKKYEKLFLKYDLKVNEFNKIRSDFEQLQKSLFNCLEKYTPIEKEWKILKDEKKKTKNMCADVETKFQEALLSQTLMEKEINTLKKEINFLKQKETMLANENNELELSLKANMSEKECTIALNKKLEETLKKYQTCQQKRIITCMKKNVAVQTEKYVIFENKIEMISIGLQTGLNITENNSSPVKLNEIIQFNSMFGVKCHRNAKKLSAIVNKQPSELSDNVFVSDLSKPQIIIRNKCSHMNCLLSDIIPEDYTPTNCKSLPPLLKEVTYKKELQSNFVQFDVKDILLRYSGILNNKLNLQVQKIGTCRKRMKNIPKFFRTKKEKINIVIERWKLLKVLIFKCHQIYYLLKGNENNGMEFNKRNLKNGLFSIKRNKFNKKSVKLKPYKCFTDKLIYNLKRKMNLLETHVKIANNIAIKKESISNPASVNGIWNIQENEDISVVKTENSENGLIKTIFDISYVDKNEPSLPLLKTILDTIDVPPLLSPMSASSESVNWDYYPEYKNQFDVAVGKDEIIPTFSESSTQTIEIKQKCSSVQISLCNDNCDVGIQTNLNKEFICQKCMEEKNVNICDSKNTCSIMKNCAPIDQVVNLFDKNLVQKNDKEVHVKNMLIKTHFDSSIDMELQNESLIISDQKSSPASVHNFSEIDKQSTKCKVYSHCSDLRKFVCDLSDRLNELSKSHQILSEKFELKCVTQNSNTCNVLLNTTYSDCSEKINESNCNKNLTDMKMKENYKYNSTNFRELEYFQSTSESEIDSSKKCVKRKSEKTIDLFNSPDEKKSLHDIESNYSILSSPSDGNRIEKNQEKCKIITHDSDNINVSCNLKNPSSNVSMEEKSRQYDIEKSRETIEDEKLTYNNLSFKTKKTDLNHKKKCKIELFTLPPEIVATIKTKTSTPKHISTCLSNTNKLSTENVKIKSDKLKTTEQNKIAIENVSNNDSDNRSTLNIKKRKSRCLEIRDCKKLKLSDSTKKIANINSDSSLENDVPCIKSPFKNDENKISKNEEKEMVDENHSEIRKTNINKNNSSIILSKGDMEIRNKAQLILKIKPIQIQNEQKTEFKSSSSLKKRTVDTTIQENNESSSPKLNTESSINVKSDVFHKTLSNNKCGKKSETSPGNIMLKINTLLDVWSDDLMKATSDSICSAKPTVLAHSIIDIISSDKSVELDKTFTPPAPPLTITQQKILTLISDLQMRHNISNLQSIILKQLHTRIISKCNNLWILGNFTRVFIAICRLRYDLECARLLCCDSLYKLEDKAVPVIFIALTSWPEILPCQESNTDNPLVQVIVHILFSKRCFVPGFNLKPLHELLTHFYNYKRGEIVSSHLIVKLINHCKQKPTDSVIYLIILLAKNEDCKFTYKELIKLQLIPLLKTFCDELELLFKIETKSTSPVCKETIKKVNRILFLIERLSLTHQEFSCMKTINDIYSELRNLQSKKDFLPACIKKRIKIVLRWFKC